MNPGSTGHTGDTGRTGMFEPEMTASARGSTTEDENDLGMQKRLWLDGNAGDGVDSSTGSGRTDY